jgi:hypothetical protein
LFGCEEYKLKMFENMVLRSIFRPKREDITGGCRKLHNEMLHNLYSSQYIVRVIKSRRMRRVEHVVYMGEIGNLYTILIGKLEREETTWEM